MSVEDNGSLSWRDIPAVDVHRIELAAALLALKQPEPQPLALLADTAGNLVRRANRCDVIHIIAELITTSSESASATRLRESVAVGRFTGLLAALPLTDTPPPEISSLRSLLHRGDFSLPLSLPSLRRLRRLCPKTPPTTTATAVLDGLGATAWDALLETLARSLAIDNEAEIWAEVGTTYDDPAAAARRQRVIDALERAPKPQPLPSPQRYQTEVLLDGPPTQDGEVAPPRPDLNAEPLTSGSQIGRFTLLQRIGTGGMGIVYAAYDPELDRSIAVKLLRTRAGRDSTRAQARLLREAQAMARLNHPNVAVVHDVGTHHRDVFVAMELIRGQTLGQWLEHQPRDWRDVLDVFIQAGRGLAAAHAAGLVHRDFKPSNAMIGDDGRVRVLDFGLCFAESSQDHPAPEGSPTPQATANSALSSAEARITQGDEMVGTPAYMAPEQFHGSDVGPLADQFGFCASLYEALYQQLPFAGETVHELAYLATREMVRVPPRTTKVPQWVHAALLRGLRANPSARHPNMDALLRALGRRSQRTRNSILIAGATTLAFATSLGFLAAASTRHEDPCSGSATAIANAWDETRHRAIAETFVSLSPALAREIWPKVEQTLQQYAASWQQIHREACETHRRGESSELLLDRQMACLDQSRAALTAVTAILSDADHDVAVRALAIVGDLPQLARCTDLSTLAAQRPSPQDPAWRVAAEQQRQGLARVRTLEQAGRNAAAQDLANDLVRSAEATADAGLLAEALLQSGALAIHHPTPGPAYPDRLTRAYHLALRDQRDDIVAEALSLRAFLRARHDGQVDAADEDLEVAEHTIARLPAPGHLHGLILNNRGTVALTRGDTTKAERNFRAALAVREQTLGPNHPDVGFTLVNLAIVSPREHERLALMQRALQIFDRELGMAHPQTFEVRIAASLHTRDPKLAVAVLGPGCDALLRLAPDDRSRRARCLDMLGHHLSESGAQDDALANFQAVAGLLEGLPDHEFGFLEAPGLRSRAALATRHHAAAIRELQAILATETGEAWQTRHWAELHLLLGLHLLAQRHPERASTALTAALARYDEVATDTRDVLLHQRHNVARVALAQALLQQPSAHHARARALQATAAAWYRSAGPSYAWRLATLETP